MPGATEAFSSVGSTIHVSAPAPATFDAAGYAALIWTEVGEVEDIGEYGPEDSLLTRNNLKTGITQKLKGSTNLGGIPLQMAMVPGDAGHIALEAGRVSRAPVSVKVTFQDGMVEYFRALVMSYKKAIGSSESFTAASTTLEVTTETVRVLPA